MRSVYKKIASTLLIFGILGNLYALRLAITTSIGISPSTDYIGFEAIQYLLTPLVLYSFLCFLLLVTATLLFSILPHKGLLVAIYTTPILIFVVQGVSFGSALGLQLLFLILIPYIVLLAAQHIALMPAIRVYLTSITVVLWVVLLASIGYFIINPILL